MKITVLGAGAIGTAVAYDLAHSAEVSRVQVCEAQPVTLRAFRAARAHPKVRTYEADARDVQTLEPILAGSAVVVSCVMPDHNVHLARLALDIGAHFVDLGNPAAVQEQVEALRDLADRRQRWVVTGCGLAPGLAGVLTVRGLERLDEARAVRVRVGDVPAQRDGPFGHRLAHSAEKLIDDYTQPAPILQDGRIEMREPLTGVETLHVDGFGEMEAFYAGGGMGGLAVTLQDRLDRLDTKILRYPGHADRMRFVLNLGLGEPQSLDVRTHLTYRDVLTRRLRQRLGGAYDDVVLVRVEIEGRAGDEEGTLVYELVDRCDHTTGLSAMQRCSGFPAAAAAVLLAEREVPGGGVGTAEQTLPIEPFVARLAARGLKVEEHWTPAGVAEGA